MTKDRSGNNLSGTESLADREARLRAILEASVDGIVTIDECGLIESMNPSAERMYGYSTEEAVGMSILAIVPDSRRRESEEFRDKLAHGGMIESYETQRVARDGRVIDVWLTVTILQDEAGSPILLATTERDVTERKRIRDELDERVRERTRELQDAT